MESQTIGHLKPLSSYKYSSRDKVKDYRLEDFLKLSAGQVNEIKETAQRHSDYKPLGFFQQLGNAAKTSKSIGQQCGLDCDEDANANTAETTESSQEISVDPSKEHKCFRVMMDVSNFLPKNVEVKILGKYLEIHAKHEMQADDQGRVSRKFTRKFEIPKDVDIETVRALRDCYGVLTVEASFKPMEVKNKTIALLTDINVRTSLQPYDYLGQEFLDLTKLQIEDGMDMKDFAQKLAKQYPSDYIPYEEVA